MPGWQGPSMVKLDCKVMEKLTWYKFNKEDHENGWLVYGV